MICQKHQKSDKLKCHHRKKILTFIYRCWSMYICVCVCFSPSYFFYLGCLHILLWISMIQMKRYCCFFLWNGILVLSDITIYEDGNEQPEHNVKLASGVFLRFLSSFCLLKFLSPSSPIFLHSSVHWIQTKCKCEPSYSLVDWTNTAIFPFFVHVSVIHIFILFFLFLIPNKCK